MQNETLKKLIKNGAIWAFIVPAGVLRGGRAVVVALRQRLHGPRQHALLLKQSAPIGIIAVGMTVVMINGNIDLSVGATYALAGIVMLDSMNWPFMEAMGDARSRWPGSSRCSPAACWG
jgi:ribose transport system permease protein